MTTRVRQACEEIESIELLVRLAAASGFDVFMRDAYAEPALQVLVGAITEPQTRLEIARRALGLASRPIDVRYQNRWDTALALYLAVLSSSGDQNVTRTVAEILLASTPRLWWADRMASRIVRNEGAASSSTSTAWVAEGVWFSLVNQASASVSLVGGQSTQVSGLANATMVSPDGLTLGPKAYESHSVSNYAEAA
jgi:hypothetical protein